MITRVSLKYPVNDCRSQEACSEMTMASVFIVKINNFFNPTLEIAMEYKNIRSSA